MNKHLTHHVRVYQCDRFCVQVNQTPTSAPSDQALVSGSCHFPCALIVHHGVLVCVCL